MTIFFSPILLCVKDNIMTENTRRLQMQKSTEIELTYCLICILYQDAI